VKVDYLYKMGGKSAAANTFNRHPKQALLKLSIPTDNGRFEVEMCVAEALELSRELAEYANEIKEYAAVLKEMESA